MPRHTADTIALILALTVSVTVILTTLALLWIKITNPGQDTTPASDAISRLTSVIVAALVGYMAGRGQLNE